MCMRMLHDNFIRMLHENVVCESWMRMFFENVVWEYCMRMLYEMRMLNEKEGWKNFEIYNGPNIVIYFIIQKPWNIAVFFESDQLLTHLDLEMLTHLKNSFLKVSQCGELFININVWCCPDVWCIMTYNGWQLQLEYWCGYNLEHRLHTEWTGHPHFACFWLVWITVHVVHALLCSHICGWNNLLFISRVDVNRYKGYSPSTLQ